MALAPSAGNVRVVFNNAQVAALTSQPKGEVRSWLEKQGKGIAREAVRNAPRRTGHLRRTIRSRTVGAGPSATHVQIRCTAEYAEYVHNGTFWGGPIRPKPPKKFMLLYSNPDNLAGAVQGGWGVWYFRPIKQVLGQQPQPFLGEAMLTFMLKLNSGGFQ